ncbi:MAG: hypothetical protein ACOCXZ_01335 [Chloroflexota bacterium]
MIGSVLLAHKESVNVDDFRATLHDYGLSEIDPDSWYPQQLTLDIQKAIKQSKNGSNNRISIGMKIVETAKFPSMPPWRTRFSHLWGRIR